MAARLAKLLVAKRKGAGKDTDRGSKFAHREFRKSRDQAAAMVNVSPRLVIHASKVMKDGSDELIAVVESGGLAVSTASVLAGLPEAEQKKVVASGAKEAARKVRELQSGKNNAKQALPAPSTATSLECFGVVCVGAPGGAPARGAWKRRRGWVVFLWVASSGLAEAIETLKARGSATSVGIHGSMNRSAAIRVVGQLAFGLLPRSAELAERAKMTWYSATRPPTPPSAVCRAWPSRFQSDSRGSSHRASATARS